MKHILAGLLLTVFMNSSVAAHDWVPLEPADLAGTTDYALRADKPHFYLRAFGDFTGDGRLDTVIIARRGEDDYGVIVQVRTPDGGHEDHALLTFKGGIPETLGVAAVLPGSYKTACGKGYKSACGASDLKQLDLEVSAIDVFHFEKAATYYYWTGDGFESIAISD